MVHFVSKTNIHQNNFYTNQHIHTLLPNIHCIKSVCASYLYTLIKVDKSDIPQMTTA